MGRDQLRAAFMAIACASLAGACGWPLATASAGDSIAVTPGEVRGRYEGREFLTSVEAERLNLRGNDIAHQFSNRMVDVVSAELKARAAAGTPSRVDLAGIRMGTEGMNNRGDVVYEITVPIVPATVGTATTHFDHRGGWGHEGEDTDVWRERLRARFGVEPECSPKLRTPEGLVETWCQWGDAPRVQAPATP